MRKTLVLMTLLCLQGCAGALGGTKSFVLDVDAPKGQALQRKVAIGQVAAVSDVNEVDSVGTYHVGALDKSEISDVRKSLEKTLSQIEWPPKASANPPPNIHLLYTHYYTAHSNNDGGVIASVDWALVSGADEIAFSEQFFASIQTSDIYGINTLGKAKNMLNAQILRRVVDKSLLVAADPDAHTEIEVPHTYDTVAEAAAPMPTRLTSFFGLPTFSTEGVDWTQGAPAKPVDWPAYLSAARQ